MDLGTIITGLVCLALFIVPILLIQRKQKQQKQKLQQQFLDVARQQQLNISQYDFWNQHFAIGLDTAQGKLFYFKKQSEEEHTTSIALADVAVCRVNNINRDVNGNKVFDLIELRFKFRDPRLPEQALEFYNKEESMTLNEELMLAEKWNAIAGNYLQKPQVVESQTALKGRLRL